MSALIPRSFIDDVLARIDIVELIDARVPLKKGGKDHVACCPFHDEKTPSFTVSQVKQFYHCFGCGAHGSAINFLMEYDRLGFREAVTELADKVGLQVPTTTQAPEDKLRKQRVQMLTETMQSAVRHYQQCLKESPKAIEYLKQRGIIGRTAARFSLGYAPPEWDTLMRTFGKSEAERKHLLEAGLTVPKNSGGAYDRFRDRIIFPIHNHRGHVIGLGGRALSGEPKYLNSPEGPLFQKGRELYGLHFARDAIRRADKVLVVEGYMDAITLMQAGVENVVATLGTATTAEHVQRLYQTAPEVVFCFDGDRAGHVAGWRALQVALPALRSGRQLSFLFLPAGEDPDSLVRQRGADAFRQFLAQAMPVADFFFKNLLTQADIARDDGRARLAELALPLIKQIPSELLIDLLLKKLAQLTQIDRTQLFRALEKSRAGGGAPKIAPKQMKTRRQGKEHSVSLIKLAVALLLHHPHLAAMAREKGVPEQVQERGFDIFRELLSLLWSQPQMTTAMILEHYRDHPRQAVYQRLAVLDDPRLQQDVNAEFEGVLARLGAIAEREKRQALLLKAQLSEQDKAALRETLVK